MKYQTAFLLILCNTVFLFSQNPNSQANDIPQGLNPEAALLARISGIFEREDPSSLYNFQVYDEEVEFILDGSWEAGLSSVASINFAPKGSTFSFSPPVFTQSVDLMSWVFINQTWYFESYFSEGFTKNTLAAGYLGNEDSTIKHVRIGNSEILFPSTYPFISIGGGTALAPGIIGSFGGNKWNADAIIRYDTASSDELLLSGMNEISDTIIPITSAVQGKWFILPTAPTTGSVSVYIEDEKGFLRDKKGRKWRSLHASEYTVSALTGIIELHSQTLKSIAIVHENSCKTPIIKNFLTNEKNWFENLSSTEEASLYFPYALTEENIDSHLFIELEGQNALLLRESGHFSPFEIQNRYELSAESASVIYRESHMEAKGYQIIPYTDTYSSLQKTDIVGSIRLTAVRYPLLSEFSRVYLPSFGGFSPDTDLCIRNRTTRNIQSISLGSDVINGTIMVYRNGTSDFNFTFDDQNGILLLDTLPRVGEQIKITWNKVDASQRNGALIAAAGIQWAALPKLDLRSVIALAWNIAPLAWTDSSSSSPGTTTVAASATWTGTQATASTAYAIELVVPDTSGYYRIEGMEKTPQTRYPESSWYKKIPDDLIPDLTDSGNTEWTPEIPKLTNEGKIAPSLSQDILVVQESSVSGDILAIQCDLPVSLGWSGAEILSSTKGGTSLEGVSSFSVSLKNTDATGNAPLYDIYLQAGIGESSFYEDPTTIKTWKMPEALQPLPGENWTIWTIQLSIIDKAKLNKSGNLRIIVLPKTSAIDSVRVRLQSGPIEFASSSFIPHKDFFTYPESSISIVEETGPIADALVSMEPDIVGRFNAGGKNRILATRFTPATNSTTIAISRIMPVVPLNNYRTVSFFIRPEQLPKNEADTNKPTIEISLEGRSSGKGVSDGNLKTENLTPVLAIAVQTKVLTQGKWHKITINRITGELFINDLSVPPSFFTITKNSSDLHVTSLCIAMKNWEKPVVEETEYAYTIYADEFFLSDPISTWNMQNENTFSYKKNGSLLSFGPKSLVSNPFIALQQRNSFNPHINDLFVSSSGQGGIKILKNTIEGSLSGSNSGDYIIKTQSHRITIPIGPFEISEDFSTQFLNLQMYRKNKLNFSGILHTSIEATNEQLGYTEKQGMAFSLKPQFPQGKKNNFNIETQFQINQRYRNDPLNLEHGKWKEVWLNSGEGLFSEGYSDAIERSTVQSLSSYWLRKKTEDVDIFWGGIHLNLETKSSFVSGAGSKSNESSTISLPFSLRKNSLTSSWTRSAQRTTPENNPGNYQNDMYYVFDSLQKQSWFYTLPPLYDLFTNTIENTIQSSNNDSYAFSNQYMILWKRPSPGLLQDLFIPSSMEFSTSRNSATNLEFFDDSKTAGIKAGFSALNIAGTKGIVPIFNWYEQDEIAQLFAWHATWGKGYFLWNIDTWQSLTIFLTNEGTIAAENAFHYDSPSVSGKNELIRNTVRIIWKRKTGKTLASELLSIWYKSSIINMKEDSIVFTITYTDEVKTTTSYHRLLEMKLSKKGSVKLSGSADIFQTKDAGILIGMSLGIGGKLTF